jgi:hypothetical protein
MDRVATPQRASSGSSFVRPWRCLANKCRAALIIGAARLADALQRHGADHASALREYHDKLSPFVDEVQEKAVRSGMALMFPADDVEIAERDRKLIEGAIDL